MGMRDGIWNGVMNNNISLESFRDAYDRHNARIQAIVPPENLLIWGPQDGWDPLCKFLGVPVPEVAFPFVNDSATFMVNRKMLLFRDLRFVMRRIFFLTALAIGVRAVEKKIGFATLLSMVWGGFKSLL